MKHSNLFALEQMNGTEKLAEALNLRGFLVKVEGDFIVLEKGSGSMDLIMMRSLLDKMNIPMFWQKDRCQLLTNRFPVALMKRIMNSPGRPYELYMENYHYKWKAFVQRRYGVKTNALELDPHIAVMVKALNITGITTLAGCNGHHRYAPNFQFSGPFNGAWFEVIQQHYLNDLNLHYQWRVGYKNRSGSYLYAEKLQDEGWKMKQISADCVQMAQILFKHAKEIRELKQQSFNRKRMKSEAEQFVKEANYRELVEWMEEKWSCKSN